MKLTATDLVRAIAELPRDRSYSYVNPKNHGQIHIIDVIMPEGPIIFKRFVPSKGGTFDSAKEEYISTQLIWRVANAFSPGQPINLDRILGASYNTRSVLESLIAHTPQFYYTYPGRIETFSSTTEIKRGHKHLIWLPEQPHELGKMFEKKTDIVISEVPSMDVYYDALVVPDDLLRGEIDIDVARRHAQIQIALIIIGNQLGFRTWVAQNDKGIIYKDKRIGEMEGVIPRLQDERLLKVYTEGIKLALLIDCIWFKNGRLMPAVMEIEHSTGVTSGLTRMKSLQDVLPPFPTRWVIVAPDEDREKVVREANKPQFQSLNTRFFPYSAVEELYALCCKRKIRGVTEEFLDCYMEPVVEGIAPLSH